MREFGVWKQNKVVVATKEMIGADMHSNASLLKDL